MRRVICQRSGLAVEIIGPSAIKYGGKIWSEVVAADVLPSRIGSYRHLADLVRRRKCETPEGVARRYLDIADALEWALHEVSAMAEAA